MKKAIYLIGMVLLGGLHTQCVDVEEDVYAFVSPADYYKTADDLNKVLTGVYDRFQFGYGQSARMNYYLPLETASEFGAPTQTQDRPHLYNVWSGANDPNMTVDKWLHSYDIINMANVVVGRGEGIEMDATLKNRMFGEARYLRGLAYFNLVRLYGGVPIPETFTQGNVGLEIPRQSVDEVYAYLIADLQYAAENLPLRSEYASNQVWRATKGAAQAMLGKVFLTRGSMTGNTAFFEQSKRYSQLVIESGEYRLEPDFQDLWSWYNHGNKNGMESIFAVQHGNLSGEDNNMHVHMGVNIAVADPSLGKYMFHRFGPSVYAYNSYSDQDYRKSATFLTEITLSTGSSHKWVPGDKGFYPGSQGWQTATPGNAKFYDRSDMGFPGANIYIQRYAEVLLNYAEAENYLNGPTPDAHQKINLVRTRAKLNDLPQNLSPEQFAEAVYRERGWEFIGEGQLYHDGIRTGRITEKVKEEVAYGVAQGLNFYTPLQFAPTKNFLWKIPPYDLNSNPALEQNPDNENAL